MSADWAPDVIERLRGRITGKECEPDGITRWMARCSTDREFCRWLSMLEFDLTETEAAVVAAVVDAGAVDTVLLISAEEYHALRLTAAVARLESDGPHVRPYGCEAIA
jgi:hypothetical protein